MGKQAVQDLDWSDPKAVAQARGDNFGKETDDEVKDPEAEAAAKAEAEKTAAEKAEADKIKADAEAKVAEDEKADADAKAAKGEDDKSGDDKSGDDDKGHMVPKSRLDSKAKRVRELEDQNNALQDKLTDYQLAGQPVEKKEEPEADPREAIDEELEELEGKLLDALADNNREAAVIIRREIRGKEMALMHLDIAASSKQTATDVTQNLELEAAYDVIEKRYPALDTESDDYDQKLTDQVQQVREAFLATNKYSPANALLEAVKIVQPEPAAKADESEAKAGEEEEEEGAKLTEEQQAEVEKRKQKAVEKAVDAANKQPHDMSGVGDDGDKAGKSGQDPLPSKMTITDFRALPEETKKRLRGDYNV